MRCLLVSSSRSSWRWSGIFAVLELAQTGANLRQELPHLAESGNSTGEEVVFSATLSSAPIPKEHDISCGPAHSATGSCDSGFES